MATKRRTKNGEDEKLDPATLERVISLLEPSEEGKKPITKKEACDILNIAYNTTRLGKLIEEFREKKRRTEERRKALRGKPPSKEEIARVIGDYLVDGDSVTKIAEAMYRSTAIVNQILEDYAVPRRSASHDYFKPELIPEGAVRDRFKVGEVVYSAQYDSTAKIEGEQKHPDGWVYRVWLLSDKWQQFAYVPAWELASLEHLREVGVSV